MDRVTFDSAVKAFKRQAPFKPFTLAMVNGEKLEVDHPEALAIRDGVGMFLAPGSVPVIFDHEGVSQVVGDLAHP